MNSMQYFHLDYALLTRVSLYYVCFLLSMYAKTFEQY